MMKRTEVDIMVHEYLEKNLSLIQIAKKHQVSDQTVSNYLKNRGVQIRKVYVELEDVDGFIKDWNDDVSSYDIAEKYNLESINKVNFYVQHYRRNGVEMNFRKGGNLWN